MALVAVSAWYSILVANEERLSNFKSHMPVEGFDEHPFFFLWNFGLIIWAGMTSLRTSQLNHIKYSNVDPIVGLYIRRISCNHHTQSASYQRSILLCAVVFRTCSADYFVYKYILFVLPNLKINTYLQNNQDIGKIILLKSYCRLRNKK